MVAVVLAVALVPIATPSTAQAYGLCTYQVSPSGLGVRGYCGNEFFGTHFRLVVSACNGSGCFNRRSPWYPQGAYSSWYFPGGFVDFVEFENGYP
jgi:hypothetical protein